MIMSIVSLKIHYALLTLVELSFYLNAEPVQLRDIADRYSMPSKYLEQILATLKQFGFIQSSRGVNGGYSLSKHPDDILILDVFNSINGTVQVDPKIDNSPLELFWKNYILNTQSFLNLSLSEFVVKHYSSNRLTYSI